MIKNGLEILNKLEEDVKNNIENFKKYGNDNNIDKILNVMRNSGVIPFDELRDVVLFKYGYDNIEHEYYKANQSDDEEEFDYAPTWKRKQLLKLSQEMLTFIQKIKKKYYNDTSRGKMMVSYKAKRKITKKPIKKCRCKK